MLLSANNLQVRFALNLMLVVLIVLTTNVALAKVVITNQELDGRDVSSELEYVAGSDYAIEALRPPEARAMLERLSEFKKIPSSLNLGFKDTPLWFTVELENQTDSDVRVYLEMSRQYFWVVEMFTFRGRTKVEMAKSGIELSGTDQDLLAAKSVFHTSLDRGQSIRLLFYAETEGYVDLTTKISSRRAYFASAYRHNNLNGIFFGIMAVLIAYALYHLFIFKDKVYGHFILAILSTTLGFATLNGFGVSFLWPNLGHWNRDLMLIFSALCVISGTYTISGSLDRYMTTAGMFVARTAIWLGLATSLVSLILPYVVPGTKGLSSNLSIVSMIVVMVATSVSAFGAYWIKGFRPALFSMIAYMPFLFATVMRALALFGFVDGVFLENIVHQLFAGLAMVLISISLEDRQVYLRSLQSSENEAISQKNQELIENEKLKAREQEATMRVAQMLAHDVRKPFSLIRMGMGVMSRSKNYEETQALIAKLTPEIDAAAASVDALILDVMEMGSQGAPASPEVIAAEVLIHDTLRQTFIMYPYADVDIDYDLTNSAMLYVNPQKVARVFSNIYVNAIQAMKFRGETWIRSKDVIQGNESYIEFCVGNSGSLISDEHIAKIFDAFFTSGKRNGTGLGLAVARKVVHSYGGRIWCESGISNEFPEGKVEFFFTLPVAYGHPAIHNQTLYKHSADFVKSLSTGSPIRRPLERVGDDNTRLLEAQIIERSVAMGRPVSILLVDDDKGYARNLSSIIAKPLDLARAVQVTQVSNSSEALMVVEQNVFDLIICDVDLGVFSLSGFDLVRQVRDQQVRGLICMHSNRINVNDHKLATQVGADVYLPKPMSAGQLLRLILQSSELSMRGNHATESHLSARAGTRADAQPEVVIIDDNPFVLDAWSSTLSGQAKVHLMRSFEELSQQLAVQPDFLTKIRCVVTDLHLDGSEFNGIAIGRMLKERRPDVKILLSSDAFVDESECRGAIDRVIGKDPLPLKKLVA